MNGEKGSWEPKGLPGGGEARQNRSYLLFYTYLPDIVNLIRGEEEAGTRLNGKTGLTQRPNLI